jgi:regulation of enolase protein 1 (concanavalin A-like superfamily)
MSFTPKKSMMPLSFLILFCVAGSLHAQLSTKLAAYYKLNENTGTTAHDETGAHDGELTGALPWVPGYEGSALEFSGGNGGPFVNLDAWQTDGPEGLGLALWVNWAGADDSYQGLVSQRDGTMYWWTELDPAGNQLRFKSNTSPQSNLFLTGAHLIVGEWVHAAFSHDAAASSGTVYLNGAEALAGNWSLPDGDFSNLRTGIGVVNTADGLGIFNGALDEIMIFASPFSAEDVKDIMEGLSEAKASRPSPADQETDVLRDGMLSWTPLAGAVQRDVYFGTRYEDVDAASTDNPLGVLVSPAQEANSYDPGRLAFDQTYYWRVDEVNAAPDSTVFKGSVWNFTTEPVAYGIADVTATASSMHDPANGPENTVNGSGLDAQGQHSTDLADMWLSNMAETEGVWIQYDLGRVYKLNHAHVWNHNSQTEAILGYGTKEALIEISTDGENWNELKIAELAQAPATGAYLGMDVSLDGALARFVRITALSNYSILGLKQFGLSEMRFYSIPVLARMPVPADSSTADSPDVQLQWRAGREADRHEVVFGDDMQAVIDGTAVIDTVSASSYDLGTLNLGGTYYWKINEMNDVGTPPVYAGDLWSFQTPDQLMIDDFERYRAQEGLRIWEHWIDGFDDPGNNGAVVGNGDDAEKSVVYEGGQSMPIVFNNTTAPASEVTRTFDTPVDLTKGNPESLKLQIRGDAPGLVIDGDTITLGASGADLWNAEDEGRFVYKTLTGDGSITAKVESLTNVQAWAKAGVMIRESDGADSVDAYMVTSAENGLTFQYRLETFAAAASDTATRSDAWINNNDKPVWVRVERVGDQCNGYISLDGENWEASTSNPQTIPMIQSVKIGLCATSHDNNVSTVAVFSDITTTGNVTGSWEMVEWGGGTSGHPNNDAAPVYLRLADTSGKEITLDHPDPLATVIQTWDEWTIPLGDLSGINVTKLDSITVGVGGAGVRGKVYVDAIRTAKPYAQPAPTE